MLYLLQCSEFFFHYLWLFFFIILSLLELLAWPLTPATHCLQHVLMLVTVSCCVHPTIEPWFTNRNDRRAGQLWSKSNYMRWLCMCQVQVGYFLENALYLTIDLGQHENSLSLSGGSGYRPVCQQCHFYSSNFESQLGQGQAARVTG